VRLALDHHYSGLIAEQLRARGHDVVSAAERGWQAESDETLLALCAGEGRALLTNNVADFAALARRWQGEGRTHAGLVFTSDASMPRTRATIGRYVTTLDLLLAAYPADDALADGVEWLGAASRALPELPELPELPRFDGGGTLPGVDLSDMSAVRAILDEDLRLGLDDA
jgi:hypothetical protein